MKLPDWITGCLISLQFAGCLLAYAESKVERFKCPARFVTEAKRRLHESQHPAVTSCQTTRRLLILETQADHFEGLGSILIGVAEALAEAYAGKRTLILGPLAAQPAFFRSAQCQPKEQGWACYFEPLGSCQWSDVPEARDQDSLIAMGVDSCGRVKWSTPAKGAAALYALPDKDLLKYFPMNEGGSVDWEWVGRCWAAAVFSQVVRLRPQLESNLAQVYQKHISKNQKKPIIYAGVHLRTGDTTLKASEYTVDRVYQNKPVMNATYLGQLLKPLAHHLDFIYLATDSVDLDKARAELAEASGVGDVRVLPRFRTEHGSHVVAFQRSMIQMRLLIPFEQWMKYISDEGRYANGQSGVQQSLMDQEQVRMEALEDLYLLSRSMIFAGTAASHFSVAAWLWSLSRFTDAEDVSPSIPYSDPLWFDREQVVSGLFANGFMHGQLNTTFALHHPEKRMIAATRRYADWPLESSESEMKLDKRSGVPLVHHALSERVYWGWSCSGKISGVNAFLEPCVRRIMRRQFGLNIPTFEPEDNLRDFHGKRVYKYCNVVSDIVNTAVDFWNDFNVEFASRSWLAVIQWRTRRDELQKLVRNSRLVTNDDEDDDELNQLIFSSDQDNGDAEAQLEAAISVSKDNYIAMLDERRKQLALYFQN